MSLRSLSHVNLLNKLLPRKF
uniref:Uncharacterized protein n=1 Tax=Anguilla anguilla TaxID=7936 RepID=A0A0E9QXG6_ANGAN